MSEFNLLQMSKDTEILTLLKETVCLMLCHPLLRTSHSKIDKNKVDQHAD